MAMRSDSGLGVFLPSETAYKDPNTFREALVAEGSKRAAYLSSMDQFYAQLEESQRQFDLGLEFSREELASLDAFRKGQLELGGEQLAFDKSKFSQTLGFEREKFEGEMGFKREELEYSRENQQYLRKLFSKEMGGSYSSFDPFGWNDIGTATGWMDSQGMPISNFQEYDRQYGTGY